MFLEFENESLARIQIWKSLLPFEHLQILVFNIFSKLRKGGRIIAFF